MANLTDVWNNTRENIRPQMTNLSFHAWIDGIEPLILKNGILVLQIPRRDILKTLSDYYFEYLVDAAKKASNEVENVLLVLPEDREKYIQDEKIKSVNSNYPSLNPKYTFDSFVVGAANRFPHAAAQAVAQNPGNAYNPLFLYGGVGLGKTHLMQAIGHYVKENNPEANVIYVTSETFTNELINAIQQDKRQEFRDRYRNVDLLMIDDVQFISKSQATQEEFFNTFNTLHNVNKQIVVSSDRPPKEIPKLEERLCSRFEWGLIADIQPPDLETRIAILRNLARNNNQDISDDIVIYIAEHVYSNIRELEGCMTRVIAYAQLHREPLNMKIAVEALKYFLPETKEKELTPEYIMETVADYYSISVDNMKSKRQDRPIVLPRQVAMFLCHDLLNMKYLRISNLFDRTDHTTAMNACERIHKMMSEDASFAAEMKDIKSKLE